MLALALVASILTASLQAAQPAGNPDELYAARQDLASALAAADAWAQRVATDGADFEAAWKLARACYWLGSHVPAGERRAQYERGIEAGRRAVSAEPDRPDGHFWVAANMGALAESFGLRAGLRYRGPIKRELETVLRLDPAYQQGSADRALGRWYFRVPGLFGGSKTKAVEHLLQSLSYDPESTASHFFLAEAYLDMKRHEDAERAIQKVLDAPLHPELAPEDLEFKQKAHALRAQLPASRAQRP